MTGRLLIVPALAFAVACTIAGPAASASASAGQHAPPAASRPLPVLYNLGGGSGSDWNLAERRPAIFYLVADGSATLGDKASHLKWTKWTASSAAASGDYYYRTGSCCKYRSRAVTITASHVVRQNAKKSWYDRLTIRFTKTKSVTIQFERIDGLGYWKTVAGRFP